MKNVLMLMAQFIFSVVAFSQSGLVASYPFNGNANDATGNGHNGLVNGAVLTSDRFGNPNSAYSLNGTNSYIDLGSNINYSSHSFTCWARRDSVAGTVLVSKINNGPYDMQNSEYSINVFTVGTGTAWNGVNSTSSIVDYSQWNCYVVTYDSISNEAKMYVNGIADSSFVGVYSDVSNTPIYIGARPYWVGTGGPAFFFAGAIDEVNIYNRVLSQHEVDSLCPNLSVGILNTAESTTNIFPNPFSSSCTIEFDHPLNEACLVLYSSLGAEVRSIANVSGESIILTRDGLPSGIYFIHLFQDGCIVERKKVVIY
jgi:hypothetical protein